MLPSEFALVVKYVNQERIDRNTMPEPTTGCIIWIGVKHEKGYGKIRFDFEKLKTSRTIRAHRAAWILFTKSAIPEKMHILHKCDNPSCVNVNHLFIGTNQDNVDDKMRKGRHRKAYSKRQPLYASSEK